MDHWTLAGRRLLALARPFLAREDHSGLAAALQDTWSAECLALFLDSQECELVRTAAICLGLTGDSATCPRLAALLHHDDSTVVSAAESALWSIWFRAGGSLGHAVLSRIARSIHERDADNAVPLLTELIRVQPGFAEAFHQRSQAHYLSGAYEQSLRDARHACRLEPQHFAALATQGHCLTALGRLPEAMRVYQSVLRLHPRMPGIRRSIRRIRELTSPVAH